MNDKMLEFPVRKICESIKSTEDDFNVMWESNVDIKGTNHIIKL